jgi:archaellum component FlaD/FlaE
MDQTAVENLAMGNMHEMPVAESEKKIEAMEKELQVLKGSIKKLMIDIRDQMNKADNPFLNVQQLQAPATAQIQNNVNTQIEEEIEEEAPEMFAPMKEIAVKKEIPVVEIPEVPAVKAIETPVAPAWGARTEGRMLGDVEEPRGMLEEMKERISETPRRQSTEAERMDPQSIIKLMQWTRTVLLKNGAARFNDLLDAYVSMGYVSEEVKAIIMKMSRIVASDVEPIPKDMNIKECVGDMYALFMILHPREKELDSRMLSIMLGYEDSSMNML